MKGLIYFILFFVLALNWFLLSDTADKHEKSLEKNIETNLIVTNNNEVVEQSVILLDEKSHQMLETIKSQLKNRQWQDAVNHYHLYYDQLMSFDGVNHQNHPFKQEVIRTLNFLSASNDLSAFQSLNEYILIYYPNDVDYLLFKMNRLIKQNDLLLALNLYFNHLEIVNDPSRFSSEFQIWLDNQYDIFLKSRQYSSIEVLWEKLVTFDPKNIPWQLQYIQALIDQKKYAKAKKQLEPLQFEWEYIDQINHLTELVEQSFNEENINLSKIGNHFIVTTQFQDNSSGLNKVTLDLMIDTGASITVIDEQIFNKQFSNFDSQFVSVVEANTAGGAVKANMYEIYEMNIKGFKVQNIQVLVMDLPNNGGESQGLLGMNFLQHFEFDIDQNANVLWLN